MKKPILAFVITALAIVYTGTANSGSYSRITTKDLAGNWVTVQRAVVPSEGLSFDEQEIPGGVSISAVTLWTFDEYGSCSRKGFANINGIATEVSVPLNECTIRLNEDGTGAINIESPLGGSSEIKIIVINKNEIAAIPTGLAVSAFTFKRQKLEKRSRRHKN